MFINGVIDDLSMIESLKEGRPHLQFILDPEHSFIARSISLTICGKILRDDRGL